MENTEEFIERTQTEDELQNEVAEDMREEELEEEMDSQNELQSELDGLEPGAIPHSEEQQNILKFLQDVLDAPDRYKTGYLTWEELGKPTFSTRFWLNLSNTCKKLFEFEIVGEYCKKKAGITSDTSLSRDGYMTSLSVTQRKLKEKRSNSELAKFLKNKQ